MNKNNINCNNCGKQGHSFYQCKLPITSFGIIVFRPSIEGIQFLMIRRKDSFGFIDFIRGKYSPYNIEQIQNIFNEMSITEKQRIINSDFNKLWNDMWVDITINQYKNEELSSSKKFELLKNGLVIDNKEINLNYFVENSSTKWNETEWEFPKGRRNQKEKDIDCALREFEEETGISKNKIKIIKNILPFEENFIGSNHKSYKHKYFLGYMFICENTLDKFQVTEVSKIEWKTLDSCINTIRPYNLEKKNLIKNINKVLEEYRLYS